MNNNENKELVKLSIAALGIVFGDIGTSPLYAIKECFSGEYGLAVSKANVLGVLSLIFWTLIIIVTFKYLTVILKADNNGEGGVIALTALLRSLKLKGKKGIWLVLIGVFAASMLYGDGMITPAISVLSAVEGISSIAPKFSNLVIPITIIILTMLFLFQKRGTAKVGGFFGPIVMIWFSVLGLLGIFHIVKTPEVLMAFIPTYGIKFIITNKIHGFIVLGAIFLVTTGAEALYADMGHFGIKPIKLTWLFFVLPALVLNYFGQGALLLKNPHLAENVFYSLVPKWALIPMVILATIATIIASQAVITGSFSLTKQAIHLGYLPKFKIKHTSASKQGQIYIPFVNYFLMICTILLVLEFKTASHLAAAYGVAVNFTMIVTTILFFVVARNKFKWNMAKALSIVLFLLFVEFAFFGANLSKVSHGAWFPLLIGGIFFTIMTTWHRGRKILAKELHDLALNFDEFMEILKKEEPQRVNGKAIYLSGRDDIVPHAMRQNLKHNKIIHSEVGILNIKIEDIPRVPSFEKVEVIKMDKGLYKIIAHFGYMEEIKMKNILELAFEKNIDFRDEDVSFFLGRENLRLAEKPAMGKFRSNLFIFLSKISMDFSTFANIPVEQIIEIGVGLEI